MTRILAIDQHGYAKKPGEFFKASVQNSAQDVLMQLVDLHPSVDLKSHCMEHLAMLTAMPEIFLHIDIGEFCGLLVRRAFFTSASATVPCEINC